MTKRKIEKLQQLGTIRKNDRLEGYFNISDFHDGKYDAQPWVTPWTISACNVNADLMLIAQDWTSEKRISNPKFNDHMAILGQEPTLQTNKRISELLNRHFSIDFKDTFSTNHFVFIKPGMMNAAIASKDFDYCARKYTFPQLDIVKPKMVICLGGSVGHSLLRVLGHPKKSFGELKIDSVLHNESSIFFSNHPGGLGLANSGGVKGMDQHWKWLGQNFRRLTK